LFDSEYEEDVSFNLGKSVAWAFSFSSKTKWFKCIWWRSFIKPIRVKTGKEQQTNRCW